MISLIELLKILNSEDDNGDKQPCKEIEFVTFNNKKKTGGEVIVLTNHIMSGHKMDLNQNAMINLKPVDGYRHPTAINIFLITRFNGLEVFY